MVPFEGNRVRSISVRWSATVLFFALLTLALALVVDVTIILHSPDLGDVSATVRTVTVGFSTLVGLVSGLITIYNWFSSTESSDGSGPTDNFVVHGDIHVNLGDPTYTPPDESDVNEPDEPTTDTDDERDSEMETEFTRQS